MENYEPLKILGEGSFGKVYLMKHKAKRRLVCVKVIKIKNVPKKERQACCLEVNLLQRLNHPNIVGYEESFLSPKQDSLFIVMQYCDGGDLASRIKSAAGQLFPERKVLNWFVQMALGLHYMHSNRILHRDLKTQNIFLLGNGRLVLGDLGISKVLEGTSDMAETLIGTPYYMSPEIFQNKPYNHKSDIWALGCVLYEMVTLNHAFDASSINGLAAKIMRGRYPPVDARFSSGIKDLIGEMLSLDPERRPDLEDILRKTLIKRHIGEFFEDIMTRPSSSLGEGTIAVRAGFLQAAQGGAGGKLDPETESLKKQLEDLSLQSVISRALNPPTEPTSAKGAIRLARDQTNALKREEERKQIVEETLAKLRAEREDRLRKRTAADPKPAPQLGRPSSAAGGGQGNNRGGGAGAGLRPSQPVAARASEQPVQRRSVERRPSAEAITDPRLIAQRKAVEAEEKRRQQLAQQQQARREEAAVPAPERPRPIEPRPSSRAEERLASPPASAPQQLRQPRAVEEGRKREDERMLQERGNEGVASRSPRLPLDDVQRSAPTPVRSQMPQAGAAPSRVAKSSADEGATGAGGDETPRDRPANRRPSPAHGAGGQQAWAGAEVEDGGGPPSSAVSKPSSNRAAVPASAEPRRAPTADDAPQAKGGGHGRRSGSEGAGVRSPGGQQPDRGSKPHATNEDDDEEDVFEMLVKEGDNDDEGDADDDLREREVELQRELDVATQRMEIIRRTIDTTRHLLPPSVSKGRGSKEAELEFDEKEDDEEEEEEQQLARRAGAKVVADTIHDDADDGGSARRGYKGVAPSSGGPSRGTPQPAPGKRASPSVAPSKRDGLRPPQQGFAKPAAQPSAESKRGGNVAPSDPPPRSGKLEDRIRESRALLNRLLGEEVFKRCYLLAREAQDEGEDLDSYEARLRSSMAPLLRERIKYADLIMQLVFMEDSHR